MSKYVEEDVLVHGLQLRDADDTKIALGSLFLIVFGLIISLGWGGFIISVGVIGMFISLVKPSDDWGKKHND